MSYTSTNILSDDICISKVKNLVELLGYVRYKDNFKIPNLISSYFWYDHKNYMSFVGVELYIYKENGVITVETRSRAIIISVIIIVPRDVILGTYYKL